jgi:hypothetical protein
MHDGKTVTFAQHFLKIREPVTVQVRMAVPPPSLSPVFGPSLEPGARCADGGLGSVIQDEAS